MTDLVVTEETQVSIAFETSLADTRLHVPEGSNGPFIVPAASTSDDLHALLCSILGLDAESGGTPRFDFQINKRYVRSTVDELLKQLAISADNTVVVEYSLLWITRDPEQVDVAPSAIRDMLTFRADKKSRLLELCKTGVIRITDPDTPTVEPVNVAVGSDRVIAFLYPRAVFSQTVGIVTATGRFFQLDPLAAKVGSQAVPLAQLKIPETITSGMANADGSVMAFGTASGTIFIVKGLDLWSPTASQATGPKKRPLGAERPALQQVDPLHTIPHAHGDNISALFFLENAEQRVFSLLSGSIDGTLRVWDYIDGTRRHGFDVVKPVTAIDVRILPDQFMVVTGHIDGCVRLWSLKHANTENGASLQPVASFAAHSRLVNMCRFNPAEGSAYVLSSISNDGKIAIIDSQSNRIPLCMQIIPPNAEARRPELPVLPCAMAWWRPRELLVGTSQQTVLRCKYD